MAVGKKSEQSPPPRTITKRTTTTKTTVTTTTGPADTGYKVTKAIPPKKPSTAKMPSEKQTKHPVSKPRAIKQEPRSAPPSRPAVGARPRARLEGFGRYDGEYEVDSSRYGQYGDGFEVTLMPRGPGPNACHSDPSGHNELPEWPGVNESYYQPMGCDAGYRAGPGYYFAGCDEQRWEVGYSDGDDW